MNTDYVPKEPETSCVIRLFSCASRKTAEKQTRKHLISHLRCQLPLKGEALRERDACLPLRGEGGPLAVDEVCFNLYSKK